MRAPMAEAARAACVLALCASLAQAHGGPAASPQGAATPEPAASQEPQAPVCPFCRAPSQGGDFCPRCGRLSHLVSTSPEHRFWTDVPYVLAFPPLDAAPEIRMEPPASDLMRESVSFASGDRYELAQEKKGTVVRGRVGWMGGGRETDYTAEMLDGFDASGRLATREIVGKIEGSPDLHLYRKLDYVYDQDGRLDRIEIKSWFYRDASDWKKRPSSWLRHSTGEIVIHRDGGGALTQVDTTLRDGRRSLRGEPEYGPPRLLVDVVQRAGERIDRLVRTQP